MNVVLWNTLALGIHDAEIGLRLQLSLVRRQAVPPHRLSVVPVNTVALSVWAIDLATTEKTVTSWKTNGGTVAGTPGPAIGNDGVLYVATGDGDYAPAAYSDSVVALEGKTLKMRDFFTPGKSEFVSSPVVMAHKKCWRIAGHAPSMRRGWGAFMAALHAPPRPLPRLQRLLNEPGFIERATGGS